MFGLPRDALVLAALALDTLTELKQALSDPLFPRHGASPEDRARADGVPLAAFFARSVRPGHRNLGAPAALVFLGLAPAFMGLECISDVQDDGDVPLVLRCTRVDLVMGELPERVRVLREWRGKVEVFADLVVAYGGVGDGHRLVSVARKGARRAPTGSHEVTSTSQEYGRDSVRYERSGAGENESCCVLTGDGAVYLWRRDALARGLHQPRFREAGVAAPVADDDMVVNRTVQ